MDTSNEDTALSANTENSEDNLKIQEAELKMHNETHAFDSAQNSASEPRFQNSKCSSKNTIRTVKSVQQYPVLKEFAPMLKLFKLLPCQAQKGIKTVDILITCIDAVTEYLVIGSSIGIIYLYNRKHHKLQRLRCKGYSGPITRVHIISSVSYMIAAGTENGSVYVFEVPKVGHVNKPLTFSVQDFHHHCITALCWSVNAMKLFSGDSSGLVVCTEINYIQCTKTSNNVLQENHEIVQIAYIPKTLLVSTLHRTVIYCLGTATEVLLVYQVGQKERKYLGRFGASFSQQDNSSVIYAARPGLKLCKAKLDGVISQTFIFKEALMRNPKIELLRSSDIHEETTNCQFGLIETYNENFLITWSDDALFVIDPIAGSIVGSCSALFPLHDIATCDDDIFILRGRKQIIRISTIPEEEDNLGIQELSVLEGFVSPLKELGLMLKERSSSIFRNQSFVEDQNLNACSEAYQEHKDRQSFSDFTAFITQSNSSDKAAESELDGQVQCNGSTQNGIQSDLLSRVNFDVHHDSLTTEKEINLICENDDKLVNKEEEIHKVDNIKSTKLSENDVHISSNAQVKSDVFSSQSAINSNDLKQAKETSGALHKTDISSDLEQCIEENVVKSKVDINGENKTFVHTDEIVFLPRRIKKHRKKKGDALKYNASNSSTPSKTAEFVNLSISSDCTDTAENSAFETKMNDSTLHTDETDNSMLETKMNNKLQQQIIENELVVNGFHPLQDQKQSSEQYVECRQLREDILSSLRSTSPFCMDAEKDFIQKQDALLDSILNIYGQVKGETNANKDVDMISTDSATSKEINLLSDTGSSSTVVADNNLSVVMEKNDTSNFKPLQVINISTSNITEDKEESQVKDVEIYSRERIDSDTCCENMVNDSTTSGECDQGTLDSSCADVDTEIEQITEVSDEYCDEQLKYGVDWIQYRAPGSIINLAASNTSLFCIDNKDKLYCTEFSGLDLSWKAMNCSANQVAVSPSGNILWILYNSTVYAAILNKKEHYYLSSVEWTVADKGVICIAVDDNCAWYIISTGEMYTQPHLTPSHPTSNAVNVHAPWTFRQVSCYDEVVWALTTDGKVVYRIGIIPSLPQGSSWRELNLGIHSAVYISLGFQEIAWIVDGEGTVWFREGVSNITPEGLNDTFWQVEMSDYLYQQRSQVKKVVMKTLNPEKITHLFYGPQQVVIASSEKGVWYCKKHCSVIYCNQKTVIGHAWKEVIPKGISQSNKWQFVTVSGVTKNKGLIWALSSGNELFCFSPNKLRPISVPLPHTSPVCCLVAAPEALWILTTTGDIFCRVDISSRNPEGTRWHQLDLFQLGNVHLVNISCFDDIAWSCDTNGIVYMRIGSLNPDTSSSLAQVWIPLENDGEKNYQFQRLSSFRKNFPFPILSKSECKSLQFIKICTGPKSFMVWAIDTKKDVYVREGVCLEMPLGENWVHVTGLHAEDICCSESAVWVRKPSGKIYRRFGITETNQIGDYWKQVPAMLNHLSVTTDDELWGLCNGTLFQHSSFLLYHKDSSTKTASLDVKEEECLDWEII